MKTRHKLPLEERQRQARQRHEHRRLLLQTKQDQKSIQEKVDEVLDARAGMDFPQAWEFVRSTELTDHHPECSYRVHNGGFLCDCHVLNDALILKSKAAPVAKSRLFCCSEGVSDQVNDHDHPENDYF